MLHGVRGAITVPQDSPKEIQDAVLLLLRTVLAENGIAIEQIVSLFFTVTPDLKTLNPAKALREGWPAWSAVPILCSQEPLVENMLPWCIRILIQWQDVTKTDPVKPVYLRHAGQLRPEFSVEND